MREAHLLNYAGKFLALLVAAVIMPSVGSAADLRLRIEPAAVSREQPLNKKMKEIFEEWNPHPFMSRRRSRLQWVA